MDAPSTSERARPPFAAAALAFLGILALFRPGVAMYDTVGQYRQALAGAYEDWHPPVMAQLWAVLMPLGGGAAPMLALQLAAYWAGLGLTAGALAGTGRSRAGWAVLALGSLPIFSGWQGVVLKDTQLVGAALAAVGLIAWFRLRGERVPWPAAIGAVLLLAYATLVRANAAFATVPLLVLLALPSRGAAMRAAVAMLGVAGVLATAPAINHHLLGAEASGVEKTEALYDLAGIAVRIQHPTHGGFTLPEVEALRARVCVRPFFWDPLGDPRHCGPVSARLRGEGAGRLYATLASAIAAHPVAYATHRLAHLNSTERWLVPFRWPSAQPPARSEPNTLGLGSPGEGARWWQAAAGALVETPLGWPFAWVIGAAALLVGLRRASGAARDVATALLVSALALEASFAVVSIASDLRYHLWPMIATGLAGVLAWRQADRRAVRVGAVVLGAALIAAVTARALLPLPPRSYAGMLG